MSSKVRAAERKGEKLPPELAAFKQKHKGAGHHLKKWSIADYSRLLILTVSPLVQAGQDPPESPINSLTGVFLCFHLQNNFYLYSTKTISTWERLREDGRISKRWRISVLAISLFLARSICLQEPVNYVHRFLRRDTLCLVKAKIGDALPSYNLEQTLLRPWSNPAIQRLKERNIPLQSLKPWRWPPFVVAIVSPLRARTRKMVRFSPPTE